MKTLLVLSLASLLATAETYEFPVKNMRCKSCKEMVSKAVCTLPGIKSCTVEVGSMVISPEDGKTLDQKAISEAIAKLNAKYKEEYEIGAPKKIADK